MNCCIVVLLICCLFVCGQAETDSPTFQEVKNSKPVSFKIAGTDCSFKKASNGCPIRYRTRDSCNLNIVLSQLFPDVNLEDGTNGFIVTAKFEVRSIDVFACQGNPEDGVVRFIAKSVESVELAPQQLTLGANTRAKISWNTLGQFDPQKLEVRLRGFTSVGSDTRIRLVAEKSKGGSDYTLHFQFGTFDVNSFLAKFGVDASDMIGSHLSFANSRMGLATLIMQNPEVTGLFSPGGGFEIVATGKITAPELPADASKFFVIVQDFKDGSSESTNEGYGKPVAAIFALYKNRNVDDTISSLTRLDIPKLNAFQGVNDVAITVATKEIFNINSKALRSLAEKFVPVEGLNIISKGLTIMHVSPNSNDDIKDKNNQAAKTILFRAEVTEHGLTWTSPQRIVSQMSKMAGLVWSLRGCTKKLAIPFETKGELMDIRYMKRKGEMEVRFNLTERVPVLANNLVSLFKSTITLFSREKSNGCSWSLGGEGRETILDELVNITIIQKKRRTTVHAIADIFDMQTLMNRTHAKPFNEQYENSFEFLTKVPFHGLRYEAVFEKKRVLKFKGFAAVNGKPVIEVIYYIANGRPMLKLGFQFRNQYLYKIVNMFYREDKIKSTWIKFKTICISIKNMEAKRPIQFDRSCIRNADQTFSSAGIGFTAEKLLASDCDGEKWKMCNFLKLYVNGVVDMMYFGQMLPGRVTMITREKMVINLGMGLQFFKQAVVSKLDSTKTGGDRLSFEGDIYFAVTEDKFPGKIYDDGSNKIMLHFASDAGSQKGRELLNLPYATMDPIRSTFAIPTDQRVQVIEFQSRLRIGSVEEYQLEFSGQTARQYITYGTTGNTVKFVGEKRKLKISNLYKAFDISDRHKFLRKAEFPEQVLVAYTSSNEVWDVKDLDLRVKKGLHFYGKMTLKTQETYETTINFDKNMQLQTIIHLDPLRYGKMANTSEGKPSFQHVNLFLHKDSERPELGPDLICKEQSLELRGYAETVGLEGPFKAKMKRIGPRNFQYEIKLKGKLYKEVENSEIKLTTVAEDSPKDFKFKYSVDITNQGRENVNKHLRNVLESIENHAKKGRASAKETADDIKDLLDSYKQRSRGYLNEMSSIEDQIHNMNGKFDLAMIDISADCINQCKTVMIPGIEWKEDCLKGSGGQRNTKCMSWKTNKEKAINVMCLLKCEAKKTASAGEAANNLEMIKVFVNRYREQKVLFEDIGKIISLVEQADEIAKSTRELVKSKTKIRGEIAKLLSHSGSLLELHMLKVDTDLQSISPPCLPFQIDFTLKLNERSTHNGVHTICFNGEFYKNVGIRMMRMKYPKIDEMYKVLEEAELRYARIAGIKKSLTRVEADIQKTSKRGVIPSAPVKDPLEKMLMKIARRRIPAFTLKSDKTVLAFHHYSPWATIRRSDVLEMEPRPSYNVVYNASKLEGKSACHQTREIVAEYKDLSENLQQLSSNYKHGRLIYGTTKRSMLKDLDNSHSEISMLMNKTNLFAVEKRDMLYWYQFTKQGIDGYLQTFMDQLTKQNRRSLSYLRSELSAFYGRENFIDHLGSLGNDALGRSKVTGPTRTGKQAMGLADVGIELQRALSMNLNEAEGIITKLKRDIEALYNSVTAASCD